MTINFINLFVEKKGYRMQAIDEVFDNNGLVKPETFNIKKN